MECGGSVLVEGLDEAEVVGGLEVAALAGDGVDAEEGVFVGVGAALFAEAGFGHGGGEEVEVEGEVAIDLVFGAPGVEAEGLPEAEGLVVGEEFEFDEDAVEGE